MKPPYRSDVQNIVDGDSPGVSKDEWELGSNGSTLLGLSVPPSSSADSHKRSNANASELLLLK